MIAYVNLLDEIEKIEDKNERDELRELLRVEYRKNHEKARGFVRWLEGSERDNAIIDNAIRSHRKYKHDIKRGFMSEDFLTLYNSTAILDTI